LVFYIRQVIKYSLQYKIQAGSLVQQILRLSGTGESFLGGEVAVVWSRWSVIFSC